MKKCLLFFIIGCMMIFSSCANKIGSGDKGESYGKSVSENDTITYSLRGTSNYERLQKFIDNVDTGKGDRINLVRYTTEGDPIITQLYFNGQKIVIAIDNSKDKFGGQDKNKIIYSSINGGNELKDNLTKYLKDNHFYDLAKVSP